MKRTLFNWAYNRKLHFIKNGEKQSAVSFGCKLLIPVYGVSPCRVTRVPCRRREKNPHVGLHAVRTLLHFKHRQVPPLVVRTHLDIAAAGTAL